MHFELVNPLPAGIILDSAFILRDVERAQIALQSLIENGYDATIEILPVVEDIGGFKINGHRYCVLYMEKEKK